MQDPCARVSVSTFMVQAPLLMSSVRSLDTLWSRVCVCKGGGGGVRAPGRSAEINKALWEDGGGVQTGRTSEGSEEED